MYEYIIIKHGGFQSILSIPTHLIFQLNGIIGDSVAVTSHIPTLPSHKEKPDRSFGIECAIMEIKQFTLKRLKRSLDQMEETENLKIDQSRISSLRKRKKE